ncbi:MAG: ABC transporter permease [Desulfurococcaceae archaeon]
MDMAALQAMIYRQVKRWLTERSRVIGTVLNPLLWIIFLGVGLSTVFTFNPSDVAKYLPSLPGISATALANQLANMIQDAINSRFGGLDYLTFMVTSMPAIAIFMTSFISGISIIWDRQFGFLKETLVAPAPRTQIILGRLVGDSIVSTLQGLIVIALGFAVSAQIRPLGIIPAAGFLFISSLAFSAMGSLIALYLSSMEGFQMIVNVIAMPLMFMSGAFYPVSTLPEWMKVVAYANPLTYAVHGIRFSLTGSSPEGWPSGPLVDAAVLAAYALVFVLAAGMKFRRTTVEE